MAVGDMDEEIVFVPRYESGYVLLLKIAPVLAALGVLLTVLDWYKGKPSVLMLAFTPVAYGLWLSTYHRIRFADVIVVERLAFPLRKTFEYSSITDVAPGIVQTRHGKILVHHCQNTEDFDDAVEESRKRGHWAESQLDGRLLHDAWLDSRMIPIVVPIAVLAAIVGPKFLNPKVPWWVWSAGALLVLPPVLRRFFRNQTA